MELSYSLPDALGGSMMKCKCGGKVANNARVCPHCGHRFTSLPVQVLAGIFAVVGAGAVIAMLSNSANDAPPVQQAHAATGQVNEAQNRLSAMPKSEQAAALALAAGEGCVGSRAFYMGSAPTDRSAFWSIGCKNGKSYLVQIFADSTGSTKVLDCTLYKKVTKLSCFQKLKD